MTGSDKDAGEDHFTYVTRIMADARTRRDAILASVGPNSRSPLVSLRVVEQTGGPQRHVSTEGVTLWDEPDRLCLARFRQRDGKPGPEMCVEEDDAIRWAYVLGWSLG